MSDLAVVIPTWNGRELLTDCLESLRAQELQPAEIIIVDDGSMDGTAEMVKADYPEARLIIFPGNRGFCAAVNAGISEASGEWIFLLNNDMTLRSDCLRNLIDAAGPSSADLLAPLILWRDEPSIIYSAGDMQYRNGRPESIGFMRQLDGFQMPDHIFGISAGAGLYHRTVFEKIGLFDETFNIYFSDSDINFRARLAGFSAQLVPEAICYHVGSAHLSGNIWKRTRQCYINHALLVIKNMPLPLLIRFAPQITAERFHQARRVFSATRDQAGMMHALIQLLKAWLDLMRLVPGAVRTRKAVQSKWINSSDEVFNLLNR